MRVQLHKSALILQYRCRSGRNRLRILNWGSSVPGRFCRAIGLWVVVHGGQLLLLSIWGLQFLGIVLDRHVTRVGLGEAENTAPDTR